MTKTPIAIIGCGPAGSACAVQLKRSGFDPVVYESREAGGTIRAAHFVENYPGFENGIMGPELMEVMKKQAARFGTTFESAAVDRVDLGGKTKLLYAGDKKFECEALVICTGATARWLDLESEKKLRGYGVSACATCDGFFFKNKVIAVVGGGDSALEEATFLTKFGSKVHVIHRRDEFRGSKAMQKRAEENEKIEFVFDSVVDEVLGSPETGLTGVRS